MVVGQQSRWGPDACTAHGDPFVAECRRNRHLSVWLWIDESADITKLRNAVRDLIPAGSDWPAVPVDPLPGISTAVLRQTLDVANADGWVPQERITVQEAVTAYTTANAYAGFQEDRLGRIAPGFIADLVFLDTDLTRCASEQVQRARGLCTLLDGQVRFGSDQ
jgi:predicted amidohydrolase YtcJ